jgi:hypothetical protein
MYAQLLKIKKKKIGTHSFFATEVDIYEKSTNGLSVTEFTFGRD